MNNPWSNISWSNIIANCDRNSPVLRREYKFAPDCIVLHAEANRTEPLLYALRQAFPNLDIEMKETEW